MADAENSQNYQFGRKKQLLIPAPQDEIVKGVNGWAPKILNRVQHTSAKTEGGGGEVTPARAKNRVGVRFI